MRDLIEGLADLIGLSFLIGTIITISCIFM